MKWAAKYGRVYFYISRVRFYLIHRISQGRFLKGIKNPREIFKNPNTITNVSLLDKRYNRDKLRASLKIIDVHVHILETVQLNIYGFFSLLLQRNFRK